MFFTGMKSPSRLSAVPYSALAQVSAVIIACYDLAHPTEYYKHYTASSRSSAGSHFNAGIIIWQYTALTREQRLKRIGPSTSSGFIEQFSKSKLGL